MKQGDTLTIKETHVSHSKRKALCKEGDKVKLIAEHGDVVIVELKGTRFSIPKSKIKQYATYSDTNYNTNNLTKTQ